MHIKKSIENTSILFYIYFSNSSKSNKLFMKNMFHMWIHLLVQFNNPPKQYYFNWKLRTRTFEFASLEI